jgi:hypothetical protein
LSKLGKELSNYHHGGAILWSDYIENLEVERWEWDENIFSDRQIVDLGYNIFAVPIYKKDILSNPSVSYVELPNYLLAISWDDFHFDVRVIKDTVDDDEPVGWLLVEQVDHGFKVAYGQGKPFIDFVEIRDFLIQRRLRDGRRSHLKNEEG